MSEQKHTNDLARETSPYLLQHAHNPVNWYPWGEEALRRAREEDKPILLSIGYSACHWCHVMEHESFENEGIAGLMNDHFINIKVDREERPDLDAIYMNAVQMMTGSGGWPMTVFLTPERVPFYAGTYFPPEDRGGLPGFPRVLKSVAHAYRTKKDAILEDSAAIVAELKKTDMSGAHRQNLTVEILDSAAANMLANYDTENGGFGGAPKFPPSMTLSFLLRSYLRTGKGPLLEAVVRTLDRMACGGLYDQIGGGFHRYSVDAHWLVPHFEKMLYDNALLSRVYLDAFLLTGISLYGRIARETLDYVMREMTSPEGGFYSTQDADSEGHEGRFYVWTQPEVETILEQEDADLFGCFFGISPEGNFEGKNILNVPRPVDMVARLCRVSEERLQQVIERGRKLLFETREKRVRPGRDEKILTSWNGLMLRAFAEAASGFDREDYRRTAVRNGEFIISKLQRDGRLLRTYKDGLAKHNAYLEDYACTSDALISLYEATFDRRWLDEAGKLAEMIIRRFRDPDGKGFFFTSDDHEPLIQRPKEFYDNATPSGNSVAVSAFLRLWKLTGDEKWLKHALPVMEAMALPMSRYPAAFGNLLCDIDFYLSNPKEIAIVGDTRAESTASLLREVFRRYLPNKVVACGLDAESFLLKDKPQVNGLPTAYVCENNACKAPVTNAAELASLL